MTMTKRPPGRPRLHCTEKQTRRNISLSDRYAATAAAIGGGSTSKGIRRALDRYRWVSYFHLGPIIGIGDSKESALADAKITTGFEKDLADIKLRPCTLSLYRAVERNGGEIRYRVYDGIVSLHDDNEE